MGTRESRKEKSGYGGVVTHAKMYRVPNAWEA